MNPIIVIDSREQTPLNFTRFQYERGSLQSGDYSIKGLEQMMTIERKSACDLIQSVTHERARFERELHRLRGFDFARLLIVGTEAEINQHRYRSKASPKSILHSLHAFEIRYRVPVVWAGTPANAARLVERWAYWYSREIQRQAEALAS
jgi:ERCC4-type nuclease